MDMGLTKINYINNQTVISADNMNDIQDAIIALEKMPLNSGVVLYGEKQNLTDGQKEQAKKNIGVYNTSLTDAEIELLNAILVEDTLISQPKMEATYTSGEEPEPDPETGLYWHYRSFTAKVTNIDKVFVKKARVGIATQVGIMVTYKWYDAEITFGETEHTISYYIREQLAYGYSGALVELTYYSLIGGINELTVEAVYVK